MHRRKVALRMGRMIIGERYYSKVFFTESSDNRMLGQERRQVTLAEIHLMQQGTLKKHKAVLGQQARGQSGVQPVTRCTQCYTGRWPAMVSPFKLHSHG